jgi:hypothetical protein
MTWIDYPRKTESHCRAAGCMETAEWYPCADHPKLGFCHKHGFELIRNHIQAIEEEVQ